MGFVTRDVPFGHPDFGKAFPCTCQRDNLTAQRNARLRALSNLDVVADKTFKTFQLDLNGLSDEQLAALKVAYERAHTYASNPRGWLLFQGNYGSGKTHLAVAIANHRLSTGEPVLFVTVPDLLDHLRTTYGPTSEAQYDDLFERIRNYPLLVLDDLGAESSTSWAREKLYQLINHRYLHRLCTVITTNSELTEIDPRIRSRLVDRSLTESIKLAVPDFRRGEMVQEQDDPLMNLTLYGDLVFETFDLRERALPDHLQRNLRQAYETALTYAQNPHGWLVFLGMHGSGKTHLGAAIANYRHSLGEKVVLVTMPDLLDYLRAAFNPASGVAFDRRFQAIKSAPLLVLDHLELSSATPWATEKIRQIIEYRYLAHLPTVFTTTQRIEDLDPMIHSRLLDGRRCKVFAILAPNYFGGAAPPRRG
jgi:DNA replication protein DnaC